MDKDGKTIKTVAIEMVLINNVSVDVTVILPVAVPMPVTVITNGHVHSLNRGRVSILAPKEMQLLYWLFEQLYLSEEQQRKSCQSFVRNQLKQEIKLLGDF